MVSFDNLDKSWVVKFVEHRVADPRILRLIQKWLKAGVMEEGKWSEPKTGSPQGSVISPLIANIYLHYAFDLWVRSGARSGRKARWWSSATRTISSWDSSIGRTLIASWRTYGNDWPCLDWNYTRKRRAGSSSAGLPKRTGNEQEKGSRRRSTFWDSRTSAGRTDQGSVRRLTIRKRMRRKLREIKQQLRQRMHDPVRQTGEWLKSVVHGYFNHYAVPGNIGSMRLFRHRLLGLWWHTLCRRSQQRVPWKKMLGLQDRWFPEPRALHPYPAVRFAANHPR